MLKHKSSTLSTSKRSIIKTNTPKHLSSISTHTLSTTSRHKSSSTSSTKVSQRTTTLSLPSQSISTIFNPHRSRSTINSSLKSHPKPSSINSTHSHQLFTTQHCSFASRQRRQESTLSKETKQAFRALSNSYRNMDQTTSASSQSTPQTTSTINQGDDNNNGNNNIKSSPNKQLSTTKPSKQPQNRAREQWSLTTDLVTTRTAFFLKELLHKSQQSKLSSTTTNPSSTTTSSSTSTTTQSRSNDQTFPCDHCLLTQHHCVCDEFPNRTNLTNKLATLMDVIVYAHSAELGGLASSNTARFLPRHGAYPILMGDLRGESILRNIILSRPRDSVFVLFPTQTALTPLEFMERFEKLNENDFIQHPFRNYPQSLFDTNTLHTIQQQNQLIDDELSKYDEYIPRNKKADLLKDTNAAQRIEKQKNRRYLENQLIDLYDDTIQQTFPTFCSTKDFYNEMNTTYQQHLLQLQHEQNQQQLQSIPLKPLVIVLDGSWTNAKTLDRRLNLLLSEIFIKNEFNERDLLLKTTQIDPITQQSIDLEIDPKLYLHRVKVTRAIRSDIGQLRRLQTSERTAVTAAGLEFKGVRNLVNDNELLQNFDQQQQQQQQKQDQPQEQQQQQQSTDAVSTTSTTTPTTSTTTTDQQDEPKSKTFSIPQGQLHRPNSIIIDDQTTIEDNTGGRVSTLHAFLVLLEELYNLPIITSHRDLNIDKYKNQLTTTKQHVVLELVGDFATILQAMVLGYHTQAGLQKAQLLDPEMRQIVKKRYQDFLDKKALLKHEKSIKLLDGYNNRIQNNNNGNNGNGMNDNEENIVNDQQNENGNNDGNDDGNDSDQSIQQEIKKQRPNHIGEDKQQEEHDLVSL